MVYTIPSHGTYQAYHGAFYGVLVDAHLDGPSQGSSLTSPGHVCMCVSMYLRMWVGR